MKSHNKIVIAVQGVVDQIAIEIVQAIVNAFCKYCNLPSTISLGLLDSDIRSGNDTMTFLPPFDPNLPMDVSFTCHLKSHVESDVEVVNE